MLRTAYNKFAHAIIIEILMWVSATAYRGSFVVRISLKLTSVANVFLEIPAAIERNILTLEF